MNRQRQPGQQIVLPEPGDLPALVVRGATDFARNHKFISGGYVLGVCIVLFFGSGAKLTMDQRRDYNHIMSTIDLQAEFDASSDFWQVSFPFFTFQLVV